MSLETVSLETGTDSRVDIPCRKSQTSMSHYLEHNFCDAFWTSNIKSVNPQSQEIFTLCDFTFGIELSTFVDIVCTCVASETDKDRPFISFTLS